MSKRTFPASPYKGLAPYSEKDAPFFFGREDERRNIILNLMASRLTLLYGESGVGKSSVLGAGVVHDLRRLARKNIDESGSPKFVVTLFNTWRDDPVPRLTASVRESVIQALDEPEIEQAPSSSIVDSFRDWARLAGGNLFVILDQFEDYFLYHAHDNGEGSFASEFSRLVNCRELKVNFLISIRDDAFTKLDVLKEEIPDYSENSLRITRLDREATRAAIKEPIDQYNRFYGAGRKRIIIGDDLVEQVLRGPSKIEAARSNTREAAASETEAIIETPFLQLVMTRLWEEEMRLGSTTLRLETLKRLGGVDGIVETHLTGAMKKLSRKERSMAASVFHYLVTPSGHKIAYAVSDLAKQAQLDQKALPVLLEKLSRGDNRILRPFVLPERRDEQLYEISLDVLAKPILDWRTRAEVKAKLARRLRWSLAALAAVILLVVGYSINRLAVQRQRYELEKRLLTERANNVTSQVLAELYQVVIGTNDPEEARRNAHETLRKLNEVREVYHNDRNPAGEGIALNNIAGFHRFIGRSYAGIEDHAQAQNYYEQAKGYYQQALDILTTALGPDHTEVATSLTGLAVIHTYQGNYAEGEPLFCQSLTILEKALEPDDRYLADAMMNLAECYNSQGKYDEADPRYRRAVEIRKKKLDDDHPKLADGLYGLARLYFERGKYAEAEPLFLQALAIWQRDPKSGRDMAVSLNSLSALYREWGKYAKAELYSNQARKAYTDYIYGRNNISFAYHLEDVALLHDDQGIADAERFYEAALHTWENGLGNHHPTVAYGWSNLASYYLRKGRPGEAEDFFNRALEIQKALPYSPALAKTVFGLARLYSNQGYYDKGEPLFQQALAIQKKAIPEHPDFAKTLDAYADLLAKTDRNRNAAADEMKKRAEQIRQIHRRENPDK